MGIGCQGSISASKKETVSASGFGGALTVSNSECKVQRDGAFGSVSADALCAAQPVAGNFNLRCFAVNSGEAKEESNDFLNGEYFFKASPRSKVVCEGVGDSNKVRVQASCCEYLEERGPGLD